MSGTTQRWGIEQLHKTPSRLDASIRLSVYPSIRRRQQGMGWGQLTLAIRFVEGGAAAKAQDDDDEANFVNMEL